MDTTASILDSLHIHIGGMQGVDLLCNTAVIAQNSSSEYLSSTTFSELVKSQLKFLIPPRWEMLIFLSNITVNPSLAKTDSSLFGFLDGGNDNIVRRDSGDLIRSDLIKILFKQP